MDTTKLSCDNCGNYGHIVYECNEPVKENGVWYYRYSQEGKIEFVLLHPPKEKCYCCSQTLESYIKPI